MSDEPVGYRNPPVHSRFQKGRSGNPGGRKKDSRNFRTVLEEVMAREVEQPGKNRPIPLIEALFLKLADCGLKGDWKAIESLLDRAERHAVHRDEPQRELPEEDAQMLNEFLERRRRSSESAADD
jgi:Family of unknown function (DUF5681)